MTTYPAISNHGLIVHLHTAHLEEIGSAAQQLDNFPHWLACAA